MINKEGTKTHKIKETELYVTTDNLLTLGKRHMNTTAKI